MSRVILTTGRIPRWDLAKAPCEMLAFPLTSAPSGVDLKVRPAT